MHYSKILKADVVNSINGFAVTLFVSGCDRKCKGCFNQEAWNPCFGRQFDDNARKKIFKELEKEHCRAFSVLGGDPLSHLSDNRKTVISICKDVKEKYPDKTIYLWTGYTFEEISSDDSMKDILKYVDILIDGPFIEELKDTTLLLKGSSNQNVIDLVEYRKTGNIVYL